MLLSKIKVSHFGPFSQETEITFEPDVTVLTGANDTGKTSILRLIDRILLFRRNVDILDDDVNTDRIGTSGKSWREDKEIGCSAIFTCTSDSSEHIPRATPGMEVEVVIQFAPSIRNLGIRRWRQTSTSGWSTGGIDVPSFPRLLRLPTEDPIRPIIDLAKPNPTERLFLQSAFGEQYSFESLKALSRGNFLNQVSQAEGRVNDRLRQLLPASLLMEVDVLPVDADMQQLSVHLRDLHAGHTPIQLRGSGVRRVISIMGGLLSADMTKGHHVITFDEPELSLHADAQHSLRMFLEALGERQNVQVIYATHSPALINTMRPDTIRVVERQTVGDKATSTVSARGADTNFAKVRTNLGLSPADSLLFGTVSLIVEGATEAYCLPELLRRLEKEKVNEFSNVTQILAQSHIIDGQGDGFETIAESRNPTTLIPWSFWTGTSATAVIVFGRSWASRLSTWTRGWNLKR